MKEQDFWDMSPKVFHYKVDGFWECFDQKEKMDWERTRWLGMMIMQPHMKKGKRIKPKDLMVFPWEKKEPVKLNKDELKKRKNHAEYLKKKYSAISKRK